MIPIHDENEVMRTPVVTYILTAAIIGTWFLVQGAGFDQVMLARSVCNLGLVAGEITGMAPRGASVPIGPGMACVVDQEPINWLTPLTSMFLHGSWGHIISNLVFFWVFGNNVEDSMGRLRFICFYLICGLVAAMAQVALDPSSPVPMVGASGAISGVMGSYLLLYPRVRVHMLFIFIFIIRIIPLPAWVVLVWWILIQLLQALPAIMGQASSFSGGVAFMAHIGGFVAGMALTPLFRNRQLIQGRYLRRV
jgi:membrane associated rhomboid family serine protease